MSDKQKITAIQVTIQMSDDMGPFMNLLVTRGSITNNEHRCKSYYRNPTPSSLRRCQRAQLALMGLEA